LTKDQKLLLKSSIEEFLSVLTRRDIRTVFQPIISLRDGSIFGYEALSRGPVGTEMENPITLFDCAKKAIHCGNLNPYVGQKPLKQCIP